MEVDSGAERSVIPYAIFQDKLSIACKLVPSSVKLQQYDQSPFRVKGECKAKVKINKRVIKATFVVVRRCTNSIPPTQKRLDVASGA